MLSPLRLSIREHIRKAGNSVIKSTAFLAIIEASYGSNVYLIKGLRVPRSHYLFVISMFVISIFHGQESIETTDPEKEEVNNSEVTIAII